MPHESTVNQDKADLVKDSTLKSDKQRDHSTNKEHRQSVSDKGSRLPHAFAETPTVVTHHHDTDDEDDEQSAGDRNWIYCDLLQLHLDRLFPFNSEFDSDFGDLNFKTVLHSC